MTTRCGFVAVVGRPNVGKSTLVNRLLGLKLSITSRRPQTTRHAILGIHTAGDAQAVFIDTPGLHTRRKGALNRYLNRTATASLVDADLVVFVVDRLRWTDEDAAVLERLREQEAPVLLAVNKIDLLADKGVLLPGIEAFAASGLYADIIPLSARAGSNVETLERCVMTRLPEGEHLFSSEQYTDRSERFLAGELVREKLTRQLDKELPYTLSVEVERFQRRDRLLAIDALIWVERPSQKAIVIGRGGEGLKRVGSRARRDLERLFGQQVLLNLWVRVKERWTDDEQALHRLGYVEPGAPE
ncbi:MAG: GTPase Era [Gammaproteobacteria bacterium]|nr:GTPase Era [Gammaproteobacteria bacterium]